ncbi:MAG: hypothetical protein IJM18_04505, partial [Clostridia bacterium]|nr:hypothetical protein [Clostridia bacterium]
MSKAIRIGIIVATVVIVIAIAGIIWLLIKDNSSGCISISAYSQSKQDAFTTNPALAASAIIEFPWEYGDTAFAQRISNFNDTIEVRGRVPAGSALEAACDSSNAVAAMPFVGEDGSFTFNVRMAYAGDYVIHLKCTTGSGQVAERDMHVQRVPNWSTYTSGAYQMNYASFAYESK